MFVKFFCTNCGKLVEKELDETLLRGALHCANVACKAVYRVTMEEPPPAKKHTISENYLLTDA